MNFTKSAFEQALENITPVPEVLTVEVDHSDYKEEIALLEALQNLRENNWENIRNPENFIRLLVNILLVLEMLCLLVKKIITICKLLEIPTILLSIKWLIDL